MPHYVLDASALLAYLNQEEGASLVEEHIDSALISSVNLSEVIGKLKDKKVIPKDIDLILKLLPCHVENFDKEQALIAADIKHKTTPFGLSLGDRACIALAMKKKAIALTADKTWAKISVGVRIKLLR